VLYIKKTGGQRELEGQSELEEDQSEKELSEISHSEKVCM
jgi:hypothetical protein